MRRVFGVVGTLLLCSAFAAPAGAETKLPAQVAAGLQPNLDLCREAGGKPDAANAVKSADLNGDGKPDFVLYVGWIQCEGSWSIYGDREKLVRVYAGDGAGGAAEAWSGSVFGAELEGAGAATKLRLTVSGGDCGKPPAPDFAHESFCDRAIVWNPGARKLELAPVSTVRMIE